MRHKFEYCMRVLNGLRRHFEHVHCPPRPRGQDVRTKHTYTCIHIHVYIQEKMQSQLATSEMQGIVGRA